MIEDDLKNLRREYLDVKTPDYLIYDGWTNVRMRLTDRNRGFFWLFARRIAMTVLFLALIFGGVVTTSKAAAPGDFLYPVKVAGDNLYAKISGDYQKPVQNRAQEVIKSSSGQDGNLDEAIKQYENTLDESKNQTQNQDQQSRDQFKATLEAQEQQLRQAHEESEDQEDRDRLEQVIERTSEVRGEIKGDKDSHEDSQQEQDRKGED